jgi:uncharacterized protein YjeT (DUF2065 family)
MYEIPPFVRDSDWKASTLVGMLEGLVFFTGFGYYKFFFDKDATIGNALPLLIALCAVILLSKYFAFLRDDTWVDYYDQFIEWPEEKNRRWGIAVLIIIFLIIVNFGFMGYLLAKGKW